MGDADDEDGADDMAEGDPAGHGEAPADAAAAA